MAVRSEAWMRAVGLPALIGGVASGVLDLIYAVIAYHVELMPVLRVIAGGWLGRGARDSGVAGSLLGLISHFGILIVASGLYALAATRAPLLRRQPIPFGLAYGAAIYVFMNWVVVPLSAVPARAAQPIMYHLPHIVGHTLLVGLPIAVACWWFAGRRQAAAQARS